MFNRITKYWFKSRTVWFAILHGLPALVLSVLQYLGDVDLSPIMGPQLAAGASIYLTLAMIILRAITTKPMEAK